MIGARAVTDDTAVTRLSSAAFKRAIDDHPQARHCMRVMCHVSCVMCVQALIQLIRVVARRLQRITFLVMYRYLGLATELVQQPATDTPTTAARASGEADVSGDSAKLRVCTRLAEMFGIPVRMRCMHATWCTADGGV